MKKTKLYELVCLISPEINEEELATLSEKINSLIKEKGGILEKEISLIKKKLAYPIKKKSVAYLKVLNFQLENQRLEELKKEIISEKNILRLAILNKKIAKIKKERHKLPFRTEITPTTREKPKKKVELKEIEKKLEEILQE